MAPGQPRVLVDDAAEEIRELVVGALPQGPERSRRRDDGVVIDPVAGGDFRQTVGHAGAAGDPVDEPAGALQDAVQHPFGAAHLPQDIHVDAARLAAGLVRDLGLGDAALDAVIDQLLVALAAGAASVGLADDLAVLVVGIGVDARERADAAGRGPRPPTRCRC